MKKIVIDPRILTNPDRILFPRDGITKQNLADYYASIAALMLPHLHEHPVTMMRFPEGIDGESFYQKNIPDYFPEWIERFPITNSNGSVTTYVLCERRETLIYLAYQASITLHTMLSRTNKLLYPDRMVFDLDPSERTSFAAVQATALLIKKMLDDRGVTSFAMTTGSKGIHVVAPLKRNKDFDFVHAYSREIAEELASQYPKELTTSIRKQDRRGRLFIDALRNTYGHLSVAPYSVRAKDGAPVATPLLWKEVGDPELTAQKYTLSNILERIEKIGDAWAGYHKIKNAL